jgi:pyridoxamine 5'-phosphate oxidase
MRSGMSGATPNHGPPMAALRAWIDDARAATAGDPVPAVLSTVGADGAPSARTIGLKGVDDDSLVFTTATWTRKAREIAENPRVSLLMYWPELGRQVHVAGSAEFGPRELSERLFGERPVAHRLQTLVSRQGEPLDSIEPLRDKLAALDTGNAACPPDWSAVVVRPHAIEFWSEAADRLHDRFLWRRDGDQWAVTRLSP